MRLVSFIRNLIKKPCTLVVEEKDLIIALRTLTYCGIFDVKIECGQNKWTKWGIAFDASMKQWRTVIKDLQKHKVTVGTFYKDNFGSTFYREL